MSLWDDVERRAKAQRGCQAAVAERRPSHSARVMVWAASIA